MLLEDDPIVARDDERAVFELLAGLIENSRGCELSIAGANGERVVLPISLLPLLERVARALAAGHLVAVQTLDELLSPAEAAALLDLPVAGVLRLVDDGTLPATNDGRSIRIAFADLAAYAAGQRAEQRNALRTLTRMSEALGLYEGEYSPSKP